jgi:menaquinone-dependent protoporphyrinogen oxidase
MTTVLVAYASKHGSTAEIAQVIGDTLGHNGFSVDVLSVEQVAMVRDYDAIVLGGSVYTGKWLKEAVNFLWTNSQSLRDIPLYIFSSGPIGEGDPIDMMDGFTIPNEIQDLTAEMNLRDVRVFHGKIDLRKLTLAELMLFKSVAARTGDYRKWDAIKLWAQHLSDELSKVKV